MHGGAHVGGERDLDGDVALECLQPRRDLESNRRPQHVQNRALGDDLSAGNQNCWFGSRVRGSLKSLQPYFVYYFLITTYSKHF